jgi:hypothetical protein
MTDRDEIWVDLTQFDSQAADGVWDGTHRDPDAPAWYRDLRSLIHRAKGPGESHELVDEPEMVATMHRATLSETLARLPRSSGARTLGRVLAMKAAAATTASMISVAAAAAATTGIVATVTAAVVVPVVKDHVVPMINDHLTPSVAAPAVVLADDEEPGTLARHTPVTAPGQAVTTPTADRATEPVDTVTVSAPLLDPDLAVTPEPPTADPATTGVDPAPTDPAAVVPAPTDPAAVDPAADDAGQGDTTLVDDAPEPPAPPATPKPAEPKPAAPGHSGQAPGHVDSPPPATEQPPAADNGNGYGNNGNNGKG